MPDIILITLAKKLFCILKNEVRNKKKFVKGGVHPRLIILPSTRKTLITKRTHDQTLEN